ncbi:hypothetical protein TSUD_357830 [Trifolium subterraneum]|uniref:Uncharacterized protein n=1 Tax=Trifolium subterraneum TaxID=3900 RepID=A0A2Z6NGK6_TRISU|nr:hypothetical protein TSUD_357830 [Trifolium subterraneum]
MYTRRRYHRRTYLDAFAEHDTYLDAFAEHDTNSTTAKQLNYEFAGISGHPFMNLLVLCKDSKREKRFNDSTAMTPTHL